MTQKKFSQFTNGGNVLNTDTLVGLRSSDNVKVDMTPVVIGPSSVTDSHVALFNGTTGKLLKDGGALPNGNVVGPSSAINNNVAVFDSTTGKLIKDGGGALYPSFTRITTSGTTLTSDAFGKVFLFEGNDSTRFDVTLPTINAGDDGKKIVIIGGYNQVCGRIISTDIGGINYLPYVEIGNGYVLTLMATVGVYSNAQHGYSIVSCESINFTWNYEQSTLSVPHNTPTPLPLDIRIFDSENAWSNNGAGIFQTNLPYFPGYYSMNVQVNFSAITLPCKLTLYAFRGGAQRFLEVYDEAQISNPTTISLNYLDYFDGLPTSGLPVSFYFVQTNTSGLTQTITSAKITGTFVCIGP